MISHPSKNLSLFESLKQLNDLQKYAKPLRDKVKRLSLEDDCSETKIKQNFEVKPEHKINGLSESEIIKKLERCSVLDFTSRKISELQIQFGITEFHLRSLISSVTKYNV